VARGARPRPLGAREAQCGPQRGRLAVQRPPAARGVPPRSAGRALAAVGRRRAPRASRGRAWSGGPRSGPWEPHPRALERAHHHHHPPTPPARSAPRSATRAAPVAARASADEGLTSDVSRRGLLRGASAASAAAAALAVRPLPAAAAVGTADWEQVTLPLDPGVVLLDIGFVGSNPQKGYLLGSRETLLETLDGGRTWAPRTLPASTRDEGFNYRFNSVSFTGDEGWIVGKPAILLHTVDGGANWERVPLSAKLPGTPILIEALPGKAGQAELTTDAGAVYVTDNAANTWTAAVQETVDATLNRTVSSGISGASYYEGSFSNVARSPAGDYVAVSSRGNFYMTWSPGQTYWQPHNRPTGRRIQNMGWAPGGKLWLSTRGGDVFFGSPSDEKFDQVKLGSRGFGILDVGFADPNLGFACGGSGSLFRTEDGGASWKRDRSADAVAGNLYAVEFSAAGDGFILGNDGILLRYIKSA